MLKSPPFILVLFSTAFFAAPSHAQEEDFVTNTDVSALGSLYGNLAWSYAWPGTNPARNLVARIPASGGPSFHALSNSNNPDPTVRLRSRAPFDIDNNIVYLDFAGNIKKRARWQFSPEIVGSATDPGKLPLDGPADWAGTITSGYFFWSEDAGFELAAYSRLYRNSTTSPTDSNDTVLDLSFSPGSIITKILAHTATKVTVLTTDRDLIQATRSFIVPPVGPPIPIWHNTTICEGDCTAVVEHDDDLYYTTLSSDSRSVLFRRAPVTDPTNNTVLHLEFDSAGHIVENFDTDGQFLYYQLWKPGSGPLKRYQIGGGSLPVEIGGPYNILLKDLREEGSYLFWIKNPTTIARLPVNALAIERDLAVTDIEVIQINQDLSNSVPLIAEKQTRVRVFTRILSSSSGEVAINSWPGVVLHGTRGGTALPGSPLAPVRAKRFTAELKSRTNLDHGFRFNLPDSWTSGGPIILTGRVNPTRAFNETSFANNVQSVTADFENRDDICVVVYPLRHTQGTTGAWSPGLQIMLNRAEALLPTPNLRVFFEGGGPLEEYSFSSGYGPYEISESDGDQGKILRKLNKRQTFKRNPSGCETHYTAAFFNTFPERALNGVARRDSLVNYIDLGRFDSGSDPLRINSAKSGVTLAHELGHNHGRKHIDCPAGNPARPSSSYPHIFNGMQCNFASPGTIGYDPISNQYFNFDYAGDLLSYSHQIPKPRWPSDFTWNGIRAELGNNAPPAPGAAPPPAPGIGGSACYIGADFDGVDTFELDYAWKMDATAYSQALAELTNADISDYELVGRKSDGTFLFAVKAPAWFVNESETEFGIEAIIPEDPDLALLELRKINDPGTVLASLAAGTTTPGLEIISPAGGEFFETTLPLTWTASDDDGDELQFQVRYSCDDGKSWTVVADDVHSNSRIFPVANLGGSKDCFLEVTASDGLHSKVVVSKKFEVRPSPPQVAFFYDLGDGMLNEVLGLATVAPGQPVTLHGCAVDPKDGSLDDDDLSWSLTGPESRTGNGRTFFADDLRSGTYTVTLTATNSSGLDGTLSGSLVVTPEFVPTNPNQVTLDGLPNDFAYLADEWAVPLHDDDGNTAQLRVIHSGGNLYLALAGIPNGTHSDEQVAVYLDLDGNTSGRPAASSFRFRIYADGSLARAQGNGSTWVDLTTLAGAQSRVSRSANHWSVELCLPDSFTGGYSGQSLSFAFAHFNRTSLIDDTPWPRILNHTNLATWSTLVLGPDPNDPTDSDNDGMADVYEIATFGDTKQDPEDDFDRDGQSNLEECIAGTDSTNPHSRFQIDELSFFPGQGNGVAWTGLPGRSYVVRRSTNLESDWVQIGPALAGSGPLNVFDPDPPADAAYYQVVAAYPR